MRTIKKLGQGVLLALGVLRLAGTVSAAPLGHHDVQGDHRERALCPDEEPDRRR